jgi:DNA-binding Xre family transcriptional regulator
MMKIKVRSKLDSYLKDKGIKKTWLCEQIQCEKSQLSKWCKNDENGIASITPSVGYLLRLQKVLKCKTEDLFEESE